MELRHLRYFVVLAEQRHFGRAAALLDVAPSALTMSLQGLERELGCRLLIRDKRQVSLTGAGFVFLEESRLALGQVERASAVARRAGRGEIGALALGCVISAMSAGIVQRMLRAFRERRPDVAVSLHALSSPEQLRRLRAGELDACVIRDCPVEVEDLEIRAIWDDPMMLAISPEHPLSAVRAIDVRALRHEPFIVPAFKGEKGFSSHLQAIGAAGGFEPRMAHCTEDFMTTLTLVGAGYGIAAIPYSVQILSIPGVIFRRISGLPIVSRLQYVTRRNDDSPCVRELSALAARLPPQPAIAREAM